jgi:Fuc2NAc and GlcNAc transferase
MIAGLQGVDLLLSAVAFVASAGLSELTRRYALSRSLLDVPNERSSHSVPTPRGGGLAIVLVVVAGLGVLVMTGRVGLRPAVALGGGGVLVAMVGWLDDCRGVSTGRRLMAHVAAAAWAVAWLDGMPHLTVGMGTVHLAGAGAILAVLGVVWATNLYNFMDGIDGLAAAEAVVVGLMGALLLGWRDSSLAPVALLLVGAAGGFLIWNWPPARLFMGDVGSGFLGFLFGGLAVAGEKENTLPALVWLLLLGPFFVDATVTLLRRMIRGERWYAAHRTHAYQRAVQAGWSHRRVSVAIVAISSALGLISFMVVRHPALLGPGLVVSAVWLGALYLAVERWRPMHRLE